MRKFCFLIVFLVSCQGAHDELSNEGSELNFLRMGNPKSCSVKHALDPEFRVCFKGVSSQKIQDYTIKGVHEYLDVARQLSGRVTNNVVVSCKSPALTVNIRSGSGTSTGGSGRVNTYTSKNYGTILHELGHAFSCLGDTYVGRSAGKCKPGQPESIMCWGAFGKHKLYADDIAGIKATFRMVHPDAVGADVMPQNQTSAQEQPVAGTFARSVDDDRDGVHNHMDLCSRTPLGAVAHKSGPWMGCSGGQHRDAAEPNPFQHHNVSTANIGPDQDGDGVEDRLDLCANTPKGRNVHRSGEWIGCTGGQYRDRQP